MLQFIKMILRLLVRIMSETIYAIDKVQDKYPERASFIGFLVFCVIIYFIYSISTIVNLFEC